MASNSIHEKILALRNIVPERGATEAEAMNAINLAANLMAKYGVTEEDLRKVEFNRDMKRSKKGNGTKHLDPAAELCGVTIARFCEVKVWSSFKESEATLNFYGLNQDVEMAEFLYGVISEAMKRGWTAYLKAGNYPSDINRHKLYWSYRYGFRDRVNAKMNEIIASRTAKTSSGTDLVVLKMQVVEQAFKDSVALKLNKGRAGQKVFVDVRAYAHGVSDGDRVNININRPLHKDEGRLIA
jgi:hypothetical protein